MLNSFKTIEINEKEEKSLVPFTQGNVVLADNLNRKS
jgi:hypothetical protein